MRVQLGISAPQPPALRALSVSLAEHLPLLWTRTTVLSASQETLFREGKPSLAGVLAMGAVAGAAESVVACPFQTVSTRIIAQQDKQ